MKLLIVLMFFFGIILIVHGIYEEKFQKLKKNVKIQYRFVPRSYYDEQIFSNQFSSKFSNIFDEDQDEWSANQRTFKPKKFTRRMKNRRRRMLRDKAAEEKREEIDDGTGEDIIFNEETDEETDDE